MQTEIQNDELDKQLEMELEIELDVEDEAALNTNASDQLALAPTTENEAPVVEDEASVAARVQTYLESEPALKDYGDGVQKRINKLTYQREEAKRREDAAVQYAQQVKQEIQGIQQQQQQVNTARDGQLEAEYGNRIDAELETAKQRYKDAYEAGDSDLLVEANRELSSLSVEQESIKRRKGAARPAAQPAAQQYYQQQAQPVQQRAQQAQAPDKRATDWAGENGWFGTDEAMTHSALGYHRKLVEDEYLDPQGDTYYTKLNSYMKTNFPHKFDISNKGGNITGNGQVQTVASVNRSTGAAKGRKVKLTQSQVAIANRLGVPLKEYAKYV